MRNKDRTILFRISLLGVSAIVYLPARPCVCCVRLCEFVRACVCVCRVYQRRFSGFALCYFSSSRARLRTIICSSLSLFSSARLLRYEQRQRQRRRRRRLRRQQLRRRRLRVGSQQPGPSCQQQQQQQHYQKQYSNGNGAIATEASAAAVAAA